VKLLLDQNLSPWLIDELAGTGRSIAHVRQLGLAAATDDHVWDFARANGYTIVSKDSDFIWRTNKTGRDSRTMTATTRSSYGYTSTVI
jgi:predicted nuclease of predicted toxin-antitoxin system